MTDEERWQKEYETILNDPASDCSECGVQLMQMHRPGCAEFERIKRDLAVGDMIVYLENRPVPVMQVRGLDHESE